MLARSAPFAAAIALAACAASQDFAPELAGPLVYPPAPETPRFYHEATIFSSGDVVAETSADRLKRFATGQGPRSDGFANPFDIVARNGRLYISDTVRRRVHVMDRAAGRVFQLGGGDAGPLSKPLGLDVDAAGRIYVCDGTARRVNVYAADGTFLHAIGGRDLLRRPSGVAVEPDGSSIYVLDTGGVDSDSHRIRVFDSGGEHVEDIGRRGAGVGEFNLPLSLTRGGDGRLYVVDAGNFRVQVLNRDGAQLLSFGRPGRYPGQFGHPKDLALDRDRNIYVTDAAFGVFQVFDPQGRILLSVGQRSEIGGRGRFLLPAGIDIDVDGRIYVIDQYYRKIEVFRPAWLPATWPIGQPAPPVGEILASPSLGPDDSAAESQPSE